MKIHCNSAESMIHSINASKVFQDIISELDIENKEHLLSLFKKVKAIEKVNDDELNFLYEFITSKEFIDLYNQKISTFTWKIEKLKNLEYANMLSSFICFMNKSKVIYILDWWHELKDYLRINVWKTVKKPYKGTERRKNLDDNENFEKFRNRRKTEKIDKYKYLEFIDEIDDYLLWIDLRSWMYLLLNKESNEIILKSKEKLEFKQEENNNYIFVKAWENNLFLLYWNIPLNINEKTLIHYIWDELFLIDLKQNSVFKIWWKLSLLWEWKILEINWNKITFLNSENKLFLTYDIKKSEFEVK